MSASKPFINLFQRSAEAFRQLLGMDEEAPGVVTLDEAMLEHIELALLQTDVGLDASEAITRHMKQVALDKTLSAKSLSQLLLEACLVSWKAPLLSKDAFETRMKNASPKSPWIVVVLGINGSGKTTTLGKLAHWVKAAGNSVIIGACDTYRAAADAQLNIWAERTGAPIVRLDPGSDPSAVAVETMKEAQIQEASVVLLDTAGRLHTAFNLMAELEKLIRITHKYAAEKAVVDTLLVVDGGSGQNALQQVREFHQSVGLTGLAVTKLDGSTQGGLVLSLGHKSPVPLMALTTGEALDNWLPFDRDAYLASFFSRLEQDVLPSAYDDGLSADDEKVYS